MRGTWATCPACGIGMGPDVDGVLVCYGACTPRERLPDVWSLPHDCDGKHEPPCDPRSRFRILSEDERSAWKAKP